MDKFTVLGFKKQYSALNLKLKNEEPNLFYLALIIAYMSECKNGFKVQKQYKICNKGTCFKYEPFKSNDDCKSYTKKVENMFSKYNEQYGLENQLEIFSTILGNK